MMCLANVYFFLDGTARQWYANNEDALDSWEAFKNGLCGLFGDRQNYTRRAEKQLKCRARGENTVLHTKCIRTLPRDKSSDERRRKSVTPNEKCCRGYLSGPVDERNQRHSKFYQMVQLYLGYEAEEMSAKPTETKTTANIRHYNQEIQSPLFRDSHSAKKTDVWRTADNRPLVSTADVLTHAMRYCRERKAVFDNYRNRRQNFDDVDTEEEIRRDQTPFAFLHQVPRETGPQYAFSDPRCHIAYPVIHQAVKWRKTRESNLQGGEATYCKSSIGHQDDC
ncbi:CCHC-type domain-containing protein [Trichonephila clavipes]|nr:CCHC-type domain-containing protein [Trichonephila clavipes]